MSHDATVRSTHRRNNLRKLIAALRIAPLSIEEISELLHYSMSGARKYRTTLFEAGVLVLNAETGQFALSPNNAIIEAYCKRLETHAPKCIDGKQRLRKAPVIQPGRHIYSQDDSLSMQKLIARKVRVPAPDPLLAAFYGMVGA